MLLREQEKNNPFKTSLMDSLKELIRCLDRAEVNTIENYFRFQTDKNNSKRLRLFKLIREGKVEDDFQAARKIYQSPPSSAYSHLKTRLKDNIINLLFPNYFKDEENPFMRSKYDCWRLLMLGQFLLSREAYGEAEKQLREALKLSERYGLTVEKIMINDLLVNQLSVIKKEQKVVNEKDQVDQELDDLRIIMKAKELYNRLYLTDLFNTTNISEVRNEATVVVNAVRDLYQDHRLPKAGYWYFNLSALIHRLCGEFPEALSFAQQMSQLVREFPDLFGNDRVIDAELQLSRLYFFNGCSQQAKTIVLEMMERTCSDTLVYLDMLEVLFQVSLYDRALDEASSYLEIAMEHSKLKVSKLVHIKWQFYSSNLQFLQGDYSGSLASLADNKALVRYKAKWLFGYKLLELLNFIELGKYDLVEYRLNAFKQLLKRQQGANTARCKYLCKIIALLVKNNYQFDATLETYHQRLVQLDFEDLSWQWKPFGYEVVNTEQWLTDKELLKVA